MAEDGNIFQKEVRSLWNTIAWIRNVKLDYGRVKCAFVRLHDNNQLSVRFCVSSVSFICFLDDLINLCLLVRVCVLE